MKHHVIRIFNCNNRNLFISSLCSYKNNRKEVNVKISDFITLFEKALKEHGDIEVDNLYISKDQKIKLHDSITGVEYSAKKNILSFVVDKTSKKRKLKKVDIQTIFKSNTTGLAKREGYIVNKKLFSEVANEKTC